MSSQHQDTQSPPPRTYTARPPIAGPTLTCSRCHRVYPFPEPNTAPIRCECGWWYENRDGVILEEFKPRLGV